MIFLVICRACCPGNALLYPFFVRYVLEDEDGVSLRLVKLWAAIDGQLWVLSPVQLHLMFKGH